jgi:hypothetical protein
MSRYSDAELVNKLSKRMSKAVDNNEIALECEFNLGSNIDEKIISDLSQAMIDGFASYEPDFVVETDTHKYIVEPKQASLINDLNVQAKKSAAVTWCQNATEHELKNGGKAWSYVLVPHTAILPSATLSGLVSQYKN